MGAVCCKRSGAAPLRAPRPGVRVGVALDAWLDGRGQSVIAARGGPRVQGWPDRFTNTSGPGAFSSRSRCGRSFPLRARSRLGEVWSPVGSMAGGVGGLVTCWDTDLSWAELAEGRWSGRAVRSPAGPGTSAPRPYGSTGERAAAAFATWCGACRGGGAAVEGWLVGAAGAIGQASWRRLLERLHPATGQPPGGMSPTGSDGLVVTGCLSPCLERLPWRVPWRMVWPVALSEREDASMSAGWIEREGGTARPCPGLVRPGQGHRGLACGRPQRASRAGCRRTWRGARAWSSADGGGAHDGEPASGPLPNPPGPSWAAGSPASTGSSSGWRWCRYRHR